MYKIYILCLALCFIGCNKMEQEIQEEEENNDNPLPLISIEGFQISDLNRPIRQILEIRLYKEDYLLIHVRYEDPLNHGLVTINLEDKSTQELIETELITDFDVDGSDNIYVGTELFGIIKVNDQGEELARYNVDNSCIPQNHISVLALNDEDQIYLGTYELINPDQEYAYYQGVGLITFDQATMTCDFKNKENSPIPEDVVYNIAYKDGSLYFSTLQSKYFFRKDLDNQTIWGGLVKVLDDTWESFSTESYPALETYLFRRMEFGLNHKLFLEVQRHPSGQTHDYGSSSIVLLNGVNNIRTLRKSLFVCGVEDLDGNIFLAGEASRPIDYNVWEHYPYFTRIYPNGEEDDYTDWAEENKLFINDMVIDQENTIWAIKSQSVEIYRIQIDD